MSEIEAPIMATGNKWRDHLTAWWYGIDLGIFTAELKKAATDEAEVEQTPAQVAAAAAAKKALEQPVMTRLELLQAVWGTGYMYPGGMEYILNLVKPFGFNPAMSVLDLTVGLGGPAKNIAEKFNIYINGMERDLELAEMGRTAMHKAGMGRRILIGDWNPETTELRPHSFDGIYGQHLTLTVRNRERLFREIKKALKNNGHFTFTDFVLAKNVSAADPRLSAWFASESEQVMPWSVDDYINCLTEIGLDCRIYESQAEIYIDHTTRAWNEFFQRTPPESLSPVNLKLAMDEATVSNQRVAMIERKLIDFYRFYAIVH